MVKKDKKEKKNLDVCMWLDDEPKVEEKMVYYIKTEKKIEKYQVIVDDEKLKKIYADVKENYVNLIEIDYMINKLLNRDVSVIDEIYDYEKKIKKDDKKLDKYIKKIDKKQKGFEKNDQKAFYEALITSDGLWFKKNKILWFKKNKINDEKKYIGKIKKIISFKLVDTISKKETNEVSNFLEIEKPAYGNEKIKTKMIDKHIKK